MISQNGLTHGLWGVLSQGHDKNFLNKQLDEKVGEVVIVLVHVTSTLHTSVMCRNAWQVFCPPMTKQSVRMQVTMVQCIHV